MYDEKMEAVYRKYSQNASFEENSESTFYVMGEINMQIQLSEHFTFKKLLRFVLPSIVMMIFTSIYSVVDGLFVSNFAGKTALAAINLIVPLLMGLSALGFMIGTGGSAIVAKHLVKEKERGK